MARAPDQHPDDLPQITTLAAGQLNQLPEFDVNGWAPGRHVALNTSDPLERLVERVIQIAAYAIFHDGMRMVSPTFIWFDAEGETYMVNRGWDSDEERRAVLEEMRAKFKKVGATAYIAVSETWSRIASADCPDPYKTPRIDTLSVFGSRDGRKVMMNYRIETGPDGKRRVTERLFAMSSDNPDSEVSGEMATLLDPPLGWPT